MEHERQHYVNGRWVDPLQPVLLDVVDPSTEETFTQIAVGGPKDVDRAVAAAKAAFPSFARTSRKDRLDLLRAILAGPGHSPIRAVAGKRPAMTVDGM